MALDNFSFDPETKDLLHPHLIDAEKFVYHNFPSATTEREVKRTVGGLNLFSSIWDSYSHSPFNGTGDVERQRSSSAIVNPVFLANNVIEARKPLVSNHVDGDQLEALLAGYQIRGRGRFYSKMYQEEPSPDIAYSHGQWSVKSLSDGCLKQWNPETKQMESALEVMGDRYEGESSRPSLISQVFRDMAQCQDKMPDDFPVMSQMNRRLSLSGFITPRACASLIVYVAEHGCFVEMRHEFDPSTQITADGSRALCQDFEIEAELKGFYGQQTNAFSDQRKEDIARQAKNIFANHIHSQFAEDVSPTIMSKVERALVASAYDALERNGNNAISPRYTNISKPLAERYGNDVARGVAILLKESVPTNTMFNNTAGIHAIVSGMVSPKDILPSNHNRRVIDTERTRDCPQRGRLIAA